MKTEKEIRAMLDKLTEHHSSLAWWDDDKEQTACMIDALHWVLGDRPGMTIDPEEWSDDDET